MNGKLLLEFYDYNKESFKNIDNYYNTTDEYIKALNEFGSTEAKGMMKTETKESDISYTSGVCNLYDNEGNDMSVDKLVNYYNKDTMIMMIFDMDYSSFEEEFEIEFQDWVNGHEMLLKRNDLPEEMKYNVEPKRSFQFVFKNKANENTRALLENVSIIEKLDTAQYAVMVEKVIFIKE